MGAEQSSHADEVGAAPATSTGTGVASPLQAIADTVELTWAPVPTTAADTPSGRVTSGGAVPEQATPTLVIVAGHNLEEEFGDCWTMDANSARWTRHEPGGRPPKPRGGHTAVVAPSVCGVVVFGGISHEKGGYLADVNHLDMTAMAWQPVCATGELPVGRDKHSAVLVGGTRMVVFGGFGVKPPDEDDEDDEDDKEEDGDAGKAAAASGEGEGGGGTAADDDADEEEGEGGGGEEGKGPSVDLGWFDDAHELDLQTWRWRKLQVANAAAAPLPAAAAVGGGKGGVWGKLAARASAEQPRSPPPRAAHACCVMAAVGGGDGGGAAEPAEACMLVFGGRGASGRLNDTWLLCGIGAATDAPVWHRPELTGTPPCARSFHACVAIPSSSSAVAPGGIAAVFGGLDGAGRHLNDLHLLHASSASWVTVRQSGCPSSLPSPRASPLLACMLPPSAVDYTSSAELMVFGGSSGPSEHGDTVFHADSHRAPLAPLLAAIAHAGIKQAAAAPDASACPFLAEGTSSSSSTAAASSPEPAMAETGEEDTKAGFAAVQHEVEPLAKKAKLEEAACTAAESETTTRSVSIAPAEGIPPAPVF